MVGVGRFYDKKPVLKDIYLSYFYGQRSGAGSERIRKSSLLPNHAGVDNEFVAKPCSLRATPLAFLSRSRNLMIRRRYAISWKRAFKRTVDLLNEYNRINEQFANPMSDDEMSKSSRARAKCMKTRPFERLGIDRGLTWP